MRGRIYSDMRCVVCGSRFEHDDRRRGLYCPSHPDQQATSRFVVQFGRKVRKRFQDFREAERFLDGLRYEVDRGTFDARDYASSNPLSFAVLSEQYLSKKKGKVAPGTYSHIKNYIAKAQDYFQNTNVKYIQYAQLEDFSDTLSVSSKTKSNYLSCLHDFFTWMVKRREIDKNHFPEFPVIRFELGYRKTVSKETQAQIIKEVERISKHVSPKIWLGIKFLSTYISIRPAELRGLREGHIDLDQGFLFIPHPKEKRPKVVPLIEEDIDILKGYPRGLPQLHFFRYGSGLRGVTAGSPFGAKVFYKWWKRACKNLSVEGVDLYGGTRHSSAAGLREFATPEQIKRATMHTTNKAFERYYKVSREELQEIYQATQGCDTGVIRKSTRKN